MIISYHTHQLPQSFTHAHAEYEITYCVCGSYAFHYALSPGEYTTTVITPHTMIFMPKDISHGIEDVVYPYHRFFINIPVHQAIEWLDNPALLSPLQSYTTNDEGEKKPLPLFLDVDKTAPVVESILERMQAVQILSDVDSRYTDLHMRCLFGLLFCELSNDHRDFFAMPHAPRNSLATKVRGYIDEHYQQPLTVQDLAKQYFVHPSYLTHCFTRQMGISPRKYLTNLRLANARKLLESEDDTVQNIALRVGFSNVNNFIQGFRSRYGVTPRAYRRRAITEITG